MKSPWHTTMIQLVPGQAEYPVPGIVQSVEFIDGEGEIPLTRTTSDYPDQSRGVPRTFINIPGKLLVHPAPSTAASLLVEYSV
jgi:hypothetical protein